MSLLEHIVVRLRSLDLTCGVENGMIAFERPEQPLVISPDEEWQNAFDAQGRARSSHFDAQARMLVHNNSVEVQLTRLSQGGLQEEYVMSDVDRNMVRIGGCSKSYAISFFDSPASDSLLRARVNRYLKASIRRRSLSQLFPTFTTAVYTHRGRKTPADLAKRALATINRALLTIAVDQHDCLAIWKPKKSVRVAPNGTPVATSIIPRANYDENVVSYYKVAKASPFPSQSFLAYYNVLEYFFLRVSELVLHDRLTAVLNAPSFRANKSGIDKVISSVRSQDARSDETEMLRNVLERFVAEPDLIEFISALEAGVGERIYTKKRVVFGEQLQVSLVEGHALSNAAKLLKHIRNAIVHSSDKYTREECHIPLSGSEDLIEEFIPLVRFLAERIIFGTAEA